MPQEVRWMSWLRHIAVMVAYALAYVGLRHISGTNWVPIAGLRLACLLLFPYRYWPTLLVGEMVPFAYENYLCLDSAGAFWVIGTISLPPLALAMPVVAWMRKRLPGLGQTVDSRLGPLLLCASIVTAIWTVRALALYPILNLPAGEKRIPLDTLGYMYFLALFLGTMVVVPLALAVVQWLTKTSSWRMSLVLLLRSRLFWSSVVMLGVMGGMVSAGIHTKNEHWHVILLIAFFVPIILFALLYGWQGAAVAGTAVNIGIVWIMPAWNDFATVAAQTVLVLAMVTFLMLGARTSDLHEAMRKMRESVWAATHDALTGLPNRVLFHERLNAAIQRMPRHGKFFALALLDLDDFKAVNDQYGHLGGDTLLQAAAARLNSAMHAGDTVARFGGDEFALILGDISDDVTALMARCQQLAATLAMPYPLTDHPDAPTLQISVSIGITLGTGDEDERALIQAADEALYQAKKAGKNRCVLADATIRRLPFVLSSQPIAKE